MNDELLLRAINEAVRTRFATEKPLKRRLVLMDKTLRYVVSYLSEKENLYFSSYFAKISFLANKYGFTGKDVFLFHAFRKFFPLSKEVAESQQRLGLYILYQVVYKCMNVKLECGNQMDISEYESIKMSESEGSFRYYEKVFLLSGDGQGTFNVLNDRGEEIILEFTDLDLVRELESFLSKLLSWDRLPMKIGLFDINVHGLKYTSSYYVLEPDFLIDVTSVSEAFDAFGVSVAGYGLRKLVAKNATVSLHIGNIANNILDELIYDPFISFSYFKNSIFKINPLSFAIFTNDQVRQLIEKAHQHYVNIKRVVDEDFQNQGINGQSVFVEPSYYAPRIGIQGRFDLLHQKENEINIVELKSGKSYRPNTYGLNNSHYHQTLLYDLILETNMGKKSKRNNFILYSAESESALRYAPTVKAEQREAIRVRNRIYMNECAMQHATADKGYINGFIKRYDDKLGGFKLADLNELKKIYASLNSEEKAYWETSFSFLSREYALSKIGDELSETNKGLASLWQLTTAQKRERFLIIDHLLLREDNSQEEDPHLMFDFSEKTNALSNFRVGDIIILYPTNSLKEDRLQSQIFKCTLSEIGNKNLIIRLRSRQLNAAAFSGVRHWNIEHDILDSSFSRTFRQLYHFAKADKEKRRRILGLVAPNEYGLGPLSKNEITTDNQHQIINKAISSQDYHLIWGPPGTGKTSVVLKEIIKHYYEHSETRLLIVAYTNRAVDEICEAIQSLDEDVDYIRIGSRYSCGKAYRSKLLNIKLEKVKSRRELKLLLTSHQIYIGTLASIIGKSEIFDLLSFGVCIVDEASQILEPSLCGLLTRANKFILIGDHMQLPAIVLQKANHAKVMSDVLLKKGFRSYSESLFERLYTQAIRNEWTWAYSQLQEQGRMHEQIMNFVNEQFYNNQLQLLSGMNRLISKNMVGLMSQKDIAQNDRLLFIGTAIDDESDIQKVNRHEAEKVISVIRDIIQNYGNNDAKLKGDKIGVITPFRAQIAMIKSYIEAANLADYNITIDTVERYQGGARDIIIISTAVNSHFQLSSIISENANGMDRKLNVALSRAREQIILIGNEKILSESKHYAAFIETASRIN